MQEEYPGWETMEGKIMDIKKITADEAIKIIDTRKPLGRFYTVEECINADGIKDVWYSGIDNSTGDAWAEDFKTRKECIAWLEGEEIEEKLSKEDIYIGALAKWGAELQTVMVFEEMSELQKELSKNLRGKNNIENIAEEIADVEIMLEQMKILFNINEEVEEMKKYKIKRLEKRLKDEEIQKCRVCGCTYYTPCEGGCYWVEEDLCSKCAEVN